VTAPAEDLAPTAPARALPAARRPSALGLAIGTAAAAVLLNAVVLALDPGERGFVALLVALAGLCVAMLAARRAPSLAWVAATVAAYEASTIAFARARAVRPDVVGLDGWLGMAFAAGLCAVATAWIAGGYATRHGRRLDPIAVPVATALVGWVVLACLATLALVTAGQRTADPAFTWVDVATAPTAYFLLVVIVLVTLGVVVDVRAARDRATERLGASGGLPPTPWALAIATSRELIPGQAAAEEAALAAERARLAGDLHASVLPALRGAIAEAEAGGDPDTLARRLRAVDLELERLMADRWPVVLEAFGLVAALEDLAERLEAEGGPPVSIEVTGAAERPPAAVERAAWRFAQVALDNAVRHAASSAIEISVAVDPTHVRLVITDDGSGFDPRGVARPGARGIADASRVAAEAGAAVRIEAGSGRGTTATFEWPRPA